ncbi:MAG: hypothetical protein H3C33_10530 [Rhodocyclaceae bacterium]|nr:hypothetical protein [Rhodocyclaceae bacterium]
MVSQTSHIHASYDDGFTYRDEPEQTSEDDLWFLPPPLELEPDFLPAGPPAQAHEDTILDDWRKAEAGSAARLARVAARIGALDERLRRGPEGWRHRLALTEAAELSWFTGDRIGPDRLALWIAMRVTGVQDDAAALARAAWAVRRLTGGPGPEVDLTTFLDRRDPDNPDGDTDPFEHRAEGWLDLMTQAADLHPITRAGMGLHLWGRAGLGQPGGPMEAAVTAARIAATACRGAVFAPLAMGGAGGLRTVGPPGERLAAWLKGMESASLTAMRHLDAIEAWSAQAEARMSSLSGRTPPALRAVLAEWPLVSAPMAESLTGTSRAAVQRNLAWMEAQGLIREVTGQGRFRMWRVAG